MAGPARRSGQQTALAEINVTPLVDVMLVLLIIFMVSAPLMTRGIEIGLPQAVSAEPIEEQRVTVTVDRGGQFYVEDRPVVDELLVDTVRELGAGRPVFLRGDSEVPYGRILEAMDRLRAAGIARVALVTRPATAPRRR
ncbi:MAG: protein TolR [Acidobacteriota bacterium]|nr:MAG: biopolymer transporter ExbD [Acidobacteriota bacterium]